LIDVAAERFWRQGFAATSLSQILEEAEVHGGSLYHFFRSKERLLLAVLDYHREKLETDIFAPAISRYQDPIQRVFGVLEVYRDFLGESRCAMGCPIGNLALEVSDTHTAVRERVAAVFNDWCALMCGLLEEAREELPADVDLDGLSRFVLTVMEGGLMQAKAERNLAPFDSSVAHLRRYFDALLGNPNRPRNGDQEPSNREV
jgi:AcrR family transcriptional regulator